MGNVTKCEGVMGAFAYLPACPNAKNRGGREGGAEREWDSKLLLLMMMMMTMMTITLP